MTSPSNSRKPQAPQPPRPSLARGVFFAAQEREILESQLLEVLWLWGLGFCSLALCGFRVWDVGVWDLVAFSFRNLGSLKSGRLAVSDVVFVFSLLSVKSFWLLG